jgi:hypothetical protein
VRKRFSRYLHEWYRQTDQSAEIEPSRCGCWDEGSTCGHEDSSPSLRSDGPIEADAASLLGIGRQRYNYVSFPTGNETQSHVGGGVGSNIGSEGGGEAGGSRDGGDRRGGSLHGFNLFRPSSSCGVGPSEATFGSGGVSFAGCGRSAVAPGADPRGFRADGLRADEGMLSAGRTVQHGASGGGYCGGLGGDHYGGLGSRSGSDQYDIYPRLPQAQSQAHWQPCYDASFTKPLRPCESLPPVSHGPHMPKILGPVRVADDLSRADVAQCRNVRSQGSQTLAAYLNESSPATARCAMKAVGPSCNSGVDLVQTAAVTSAAAMEASASFTSSVTTEKAEAILLCVVVDSLAKSRKRLRQPTGRSFPDA